MEMGNSKPHYITTRVVIQYSISYNNSSNKVEYLGLIVVARTQLVIAKIYQELTITTTK